VERLVVVRVMFHKGTNRPRTAPLLIAIGIVLQYWTHYAAWRC
jgi:hypothetical protein